MNRAHAAGNTERRRKLLLTQAPPSNDSMAAIAEAMQRVYTALDETLLYHTRTSNSSVVLNAIDIISQVFQTHMPEQLHELLGGNITIAEFESATSLEAMGLVYDADCAAIRCTASNVFDEAVLHKSPPAPPAPKAPPATKSNDDGLPEWVAIVALVSAVLGGACCGAAVVLAVLKSSRKNPNDNDKMKYRAAVANGKSTAGSNKPAPPGNDLPGEHIVVELQNGGAPSPREPDQAAGYSSSPQNPYLHEMEAMIERKVQEGFRQIQEERARRMEEERARRLQARGSGDTSSSSRPEHYQERSPRPQPRRQIPAHREHPGESPQRRHHSRSPRPHSREQRPADAYESRHRDVHAASAAEVDNLPMPEPSRPKERPPDPPSQPGPALEGGRDRRSSRNGNPDQYHSQRRRRDDEYAVYDDPDY